MNLFTKEMPHYIKREIELMQEKLSPLMKKVSRYALWTMPLIWVSLFNLGYTLFFGEITQETIPTILIYAIIGALGFALFRELRFHQKEIQKQSSAYIIDRINNSEVATDYHKKEYITLIKEQPNAHAINHFIQFLMEENQRKHMLQ
ncbi:DUF5392 family protein [Bacillus coreaensis]